MTAAIRGARPVLVVVLCLTLAGCGASSPFGSLGAGSARGDAVRQPVRTRGAETVAVNRYLWSAALETLSFLPIQSVDPFTGVIVTGYGVPPGGATAYRATVYVTDPALDARSLNVAIASRGGPVAAETTRAVEEAILTRARQLRVRDGAL